MSARNRTERRSAWWRVVPLGIFLVGLGILWGRSIERRRSVATTAVASTASNAVRNRTAISEQRLVALEREVRRLRAVNVLRPSQPSEMEAADEHSASEAVAEDNTPPEPVDLAERDRLAEAARRDFLDRLSDELATEPFDQGWRRDTERVISELLPERFGSEIAVDDISCASSLCRARLTHPGSTRLPENKLMAFLTERESLGGMEIHFDTGDNGVTTLYFLRAEEP